MNPRTVTRTFVFVALMLDLVSQAPTHNSGKGTSR
jgi:hypothetical protein